MTLIARLISIHSSLNVTQRVCLMNIIQAGISANTVLNYYLPKLIQDLSHFPMPQKELAFVFGVHSFINSVMLPAVVHPL